MGKNDYFIRTFWNYLTFKDLVLLTPASVEFSELIFDFSTDVRCPSSFSKSSKRFVIWSKISPGFDPVTDWALLFAWFDVGLKIIRSRNMSFSSHFSFLVLVDRSYKKQIIQFVCLFFIVPVLPCKQKTWDEKLNSLLSGLPKES